jgi:nucleotide-binding universal stress UspA family protein
MTITVIAAGIDGSVAVGEFGGPGLRARLRPPTWAGSPGRGCPAMLGSVSQAVLHKAGRSVAIIPAAAVGG